MVEIQVDLHTQNMGPTFFSFFWILNSGGPSGMWEVVTVSFNHFLSLELNLLCYNITLYSLSHTSFSYWLREIILWTLAHVSLTTIFSQLGREMARLYLERAFLILHIPFTSASRWRGSRSVFIDSTILFPYFKKESYIGLLVYSY